MPTKTLFGIAGGLAGGIINDIYTQRQNKRNAALNQHYWNIQNQKLWEQSEQSAENALQRQYKLYNDLQSAQALVEQYKKAGLNPALLYSMGGAGGHITSAPQGQAQGGQGAPLMGLQNFMNMDPLTLAQIKNLDADTDKKKAETDNQKLTSATIELENELKKIQIQLDNNNLTFSNETLIASIDAVKANTQSAIEEVKEKRRNNQIGDATMNEEIDRIKANSTNTILQGEMMLWEIEQIKVINENTKMDTKVKQASIEKIRAETAMYKQTLFKLINETNHELYKIENTKQLTAYYEKLTELGEKEFQAKYGNDWNKQDWFNVVDMVIKGVMAGLGMYVGTARVGQIKQKTTNVGGYQYTTP